MCAPPFKRLQDSSAGTMAIIYYVLRYVWSKLDVGCCHGSGHARCLRGLACRTCTKMDQLARVARSSTGVDDEIGRLSRLHQQRRIPSERYTRGKCRGACGPSKYERHVWTTLNTTLDGFSPPLQIRRQGTVADGPLDRLVRMSDSGQHGLRRCETMIPIFA